jgi:hypothetical protein
MRRDELADWIERYELAWRSAGTRPLEGLFSAGATYRASPFDEPIVGREAIAAFWEAEREGPDESFTLSWEPVALDGDVAVARVEVRYDGPPARTYRDLWIVRLDAGGRCVAFEEWPFFPTQRRTAE